MAGASSREIKNRIRSMRSTRQITRAMEMVAAVKLRRAQEMAWNARPFQDALENTVQMLGAADMASPYYARRAAGKVALVVVAGDRGLAGGYNGNVLKLAMEEAAVATLLPIGKKAADFFRDEQLLTDRYSQAEAVTFADCRSLAALLCEGYLRGDFDQVRLIYTKFVSVLSQVPTSVDILPLQRAQVHREMLLEPDAATVAQAIVPEYVAGILYGGLREGLAAEQAARRNAMNAATRNADELIADLSQRYNRARQAAITQEITEIVAGS